jgi:hypothetical protein
VEVFTAASTFSTTEWFLAAYACDRQRRRPLVIGITREVYLAEEDVDETLVSALGAEGLAVLDDALHERREVPRAQNHRLLVSAYRRVDHLLHLLRHPMSDAGTRCEYRSTRK